MKQAVGILLMLALLVGAGFLLVNPGSSEEPLPTANTVEEVVEEPVVEEIIEVVNPLEGQVQFTLDSMEISETDDDHALLEELTFSLEHDLDREFLPELFLYIYDADSPQRDIAQGAYHVDPLAAGESGETRIFVDHGMRDFSVNKNIVFEFREGDHSVEFFESVDLEDYFFNKHPQKVIVEEAPANAVYLEDYEAKKKAEDYISMSQVSISVYNAQDSVQDYKVKFFVYGEDDDNYFKRSPRETFDFEALEPFETRTESFLLTGVGLNKIEEAKTVKLQLLDASKHIVEENVQTSTLVPTQ